MKANCRTINTFDDKVTTWLISLHIWDVRKTAPRKSNDAETDDCGPIRAICEVEAPWEYSLVG